MKTLTILCFWLAAGLLLSGCGKTAGPGAADEKPQLHKDVPPHGGTPVALGDDYNLELVRDPDTGTLTGYVLDDEMEEFMRASNASIIIAAVVNGQPRNLVLMAVADSATGETVGNTSMFQGQADWLKTTGNFDGSVQSITIRGTSFSGVKFNFPKGNESG